MKVLVLTPYLPHRRVGHGGGTAVRDLVRHLADRHEVMVASMIRPGEENLVGDVESLGVKVTPLPFQDAHLQGLQRFRLVMNRGNALARSFGTGYPLYAEKYWSKTLSRKILALVQEFQPDAIQIEYLQMALYCRDIRQWRDAAGRTSPRLVLNSHELGSLPRERRALRAGSALHRTIAQRDAAAWRRLQVATTAWADRTLCVTQQDHDLLAAMGGQDLSVVPLGMDTKAIEADWQPELPERFLFVGSFAHRPNVLAAEFLIKDIWPLVSLKRPAARLVFAGRGSEEFLASHGSPSDWEAKQVDALGFVDDLTPLFRACRLFIAPLPEGGGIKIKILETMARGVPVVTTEVGVEGIACRADEAAIVAPCNQEFAAAAMALADDMEGSKKLATTARAHIESKFSWDTIADRLGDIYRGED